MNRTIAVAALAVLLIPLAGHSQPPPSPTQIAELMTRRAAEGETEGRVLSVYSSQPGSLPRTAQATLECQLYDGQVSNCRIYSQSAPIGESLLSQSNLLWMSVNRPPGDRTVHVMFDIADRTAAIGRSDPAGVVILAPRSERPENSGFRALDTDRDGRLSDAEARAIDANRDGKIDMAEFERNFRVAAGRPGRSFGHFDLDDDGVIYIAELTGAYRPQSILDLGN